MHSFKSVKKYTHMYIHIYLDISNHECYLLMVSYLHCKFFDRLWKFVLDNNEQ